MIFSSLYFLYKVVFTFFATNIILGGLIVITSKNPIHGVLALIFAFFNSSCLFILLNAEFLAYLFLIVYVGAIAILFLFVIMMLSIKEVEIHSLLTPYNILIFLAMLLITVNFLSYNQMSEGNYETMGLIDRNQFFPLMTQEHIPFVFQVFPLDWWNFPRSVFLDDLENGYWLDYSKNTGEAVYSSKQGYMLGSVLFTDYVLYLIAAAIILLVAMIGAICITAKFSYLSKRQRVTEQIARRPYKNNYLFF